VFLVHRRDIVEPVEVGYRLHISLVLDQLLGAAVQQADMRVGALDHLAVQLDHKPEHAMRGRMLRPEVQGQVLDLGLGHYAPSFTALPSAFSSPGRMYLAPSHGLMKSKVRKSWASETGS